MKYFVAPRTVACSVAAVILALVISTAAYASHDDTLYAKWGCPTADGPIDIARAYELGNDTTAIGDAHGCFGFPMPLAIEPVRFVKRVIEGNGDFAFVWEIRFPGDVDTFFTNFNAEAHTILLRQTSSL